ncbi:MAG TPA: hypothetical protein VLT33_11985 [Labilithrix sp.]|nr:hypothetical protein [Labilithrix sp.]
MLLYRPVGLEELRLVYQARMTAFPPRLPDQPIFYPVTNAAYATHIARDWNTRSGTKGGFVTRFVVSDSYVSKFERRVVGAKEHEELWVPAEELAELNSHIEGRIEVIGAYFGEGYRGEIADAPGLVGEDAHEQFVGLARTLAHSPFDAVRELAVNHVAVFLNFLLWEHEDFAADGFDSESRAELLGALKRVWAESESHGTIPLGVAVTTTTATAFA